MYQLITFPNSSRKCLDLLAWISLFRANITKKNVSETEINYLQILTEKKRELCEHLQIYSRQYGNNNIRLTYDNLQRTIALAVPLVRDFMEQRYFKALYKEKKDSFWSSYQLEDNDYINLARKLLVEIFNDRFLIPLEKEDLEFSLDIKHIDTEEYFKMLVSNSYRDDLDKSDIISIPQTDIVAKIECIKTAFGTFAYNSIEICVEFKRYNFKTKDYVIQDSDY